MNHPAHYTMSTWSSAFIPFCAFKADLNFSENSLDLLGITYPLCSSFLPTILEGQLCHKLTLSLQSGQGRENSLMLLLDYNVERSLQTLSQIKSSSALPSKKIINYDSNTRSDRIKSAKVHINTLSPYNGFGEGAFFITVVKRMRSTEDFLNMPSEDRKCSVETYEDCRTRRLLEECNCIPWELPGFEVRTLNTRHCANCFTGCTEMRHPRQGLHCQQIDFHI